MTGPTPILSVVVATGAMAADRQACFAALAGQQSASDAFEVIEVDIESEGNLGRAWNLGAARAGGRVLLFLRDDFIPSSTLVADHLRLWREHAGSVAIGSTRPDPRAAGFTRYYGEHVGVESPLTVCGDCVLSMSRDVFAASGGFAAGLVWGTDMEFVARASRLGVALERSARPAAERRLPRTFRSIAARLDAEGRASVELYRRHPDLLPSLKLGMFSDASEAALLMRRILLGIGGPVASLRLFETILSRGGRRDAWYRFLAAYLYWRGVRRALADGDLWQRFTRGPVILMYHAIGGPDEAPGCYVVPAKRFARQMRWLKMAGYRVLQMDELLRHRREHRLPPPRSVVITFDDGYLDNRTLATPVLARLGLTATFFLVTRRMGTTNSWDREGELAGRPLLSWADVRSMLDAGMSVGAHTCTHPALPTLSPDDAAAEVDQARADLLRELGTGGETFAYPYGRFDDASRAAVERAGYLAACCSRSGVNDPAVAPFQLRRLEVRGTDSLWRFVRSVRRGRARRARSAV